MKYMEIMTPSSPYVQNLIKKLSPPLGELSYSIMHVKYIHNIFRI